MIISCDDLIETSFGQDVSIVYGIHIPVVSPTSSNQEFDLILTNVISPDHEVRKISYMFFKISE